MELINYRENYINDILLVKGEKNFCFFKLHISHAISCCNVCVLVDPKRR